MPQDAPRTVRYRCRSPLIFSQLIIPLQRRLDEVEDDEASRSFLPVRGRSSSPLPPNKRVVVSGTHDHAISIGTPAPWRMSPTVVNPPGRSLKPAKHNPFQNKPKEIRPAVVNGLSTLPRGKLFHSDWNLDHLKEKKRRSGSSLPFKVDSKGKPLVPVALGSRQRMSSKS